MKVLIVMDSFSADVRAYIYRSISVFYGLNQVNTHKHFHTMLQRDSVALITQMSLLL